MFIDIIMPLQFACDIHMYVLHIYAYYFNLILKRQGFVFSDHFTLNVLYFKGDKQIFHNIRYFMLSVFMLSKKKYALVHSNFAGPVIKFQLT